MSASQYATTDPARTLWSDPSFYPERFEKSAAALVAVHRVLTADTAANSLPFQRLFDFVSDAVPEHFHCLWNDPAAYYWVRRAVHFTAALHGAPMGRIEAAYCAEVGASRPAAALAFHLADFNRFALSLAILSGRDFALPEPYLATLPLALPGTDLVISGSGVISIDAFSAGRVEATYQGDRVALTLLDDSQSASASAPRIERCPFVEFGGLRVPLNPALFHLPGLGLAREWTEPSTDFQRLGSQSLIEALSLVARSQPESFDQFRHALKVLALKPMRDGTFSSLSSSELPGAFICSVPCDPYELAATLIHEFHHNRLFYLEESGAFFEAGGEDSIEGENHYSPWRDGPRPLHGLLHALYVYLPVFRFWVSIMEARQLQGDQRAFALDQIARIPFQLKIGVNQIRRHARLTPFGTALFEQMATEAAAAEAQASAAGASMATPAMSARASGCLRPMLDVNHRPRSVGETLLEHLATRDTLSECAAERRWLAAELSRASG